MAKETVIPIYTPPSDLPSPNSHWVTEKISSLVLTPNTPIEWLATFGLTFLGSFALLLAIAYLRRRR